MKLLLFVFGSLRFQAWGGFSERFLNLCGVKGVHLYRLDCRNGVLYAETSLAGFRKLRRCATGSGMRIKILEKKGLPFVYARFAERIGLFIGIALCAFFLFFYTRSVWHIEIEGNERIAAQQVLDALAANGVCEGTLKKNIDTKRLTFSLYEAVPDIAWLNIGIDGSALTVNLREVTQKPSKRDSAGICNIVARRGGVITSVRVFEGEAAVQEGDGVSEGALLVSGILYHEEAKRNTFHAARAEIFAETKVTKRITVPKKRSEQLFTGKSRRVKILKLFRFRVPLYLFTPHYALQEISRTQTPLVLGGKALPVSVETTEMKEMKTRVKTITRDEAAALADAQRRRDEKRFPESTKILAREQSVLENEDSFVFTQSYTLLENIAKRVPIQINVNNNVENEAKR